ncbi:tetratricopeptide repeat protein [candidate division KSB1 bacterium]|nr:tetratricopeptide repeat protein [candidate division KSB1 bacterium]
MSADATVQGPRWAEWHGWPVLLVGLAVLLRVLHIWNSHTNPTFWVPAVDPQWYDEAAQRITRGEWGPFPLFRAPLYPTLLAGVYAVFGRDLVAARMLNVLLQGAAVWAVFRAGKSYFGSIAAIVAAALLALNGTCIFYGGELLSVSAEILAATLVAWATLRLSRDSTPASLLLCGLVWGAAAILRPNFLMVAPLALLAAAYWMRRSNAPLKLLGVWLVGLALPIVPVTAANYVRGHEFVLIATQGGVNLWIGNNPESTGILSVLPGYGSTWTMQDAELQAERETGRQLRSGELSDFYADKAWRFLLSHPWDSFRFMIHKTALFCNRFEISNNKHILHFSALSPWLPWLIYLNFGVLVPLSLLGGWVTRREAGTRLLVGMVAAYAVSVILFFVTSRFRLPAVPWLCWLSGIGVAWSVSVIRGGRTRRLLPLTLLIPGCALAYLNLWQLREAPEGWARSMEGNAYLKLNQLDSARVCFSDGLRDGEQPARDALNLGVVFYRKQRLDSARYWYETSLRYDPHNPQAWNNLGTVQEMLGDTAGAFASYRRAIQERPLALDARHNLAGLNFRVGIRYLKLGADSLGAAYLDSCIFYEPTPVAHYNLAIALGRMNFQGEAIAHLDRALVLDPGLSEARRLRDQLLPLFGQ